MESLNSVFNLVFEPGRDVSFDEAMIATLARIVFRVYLRDKPIKRGLKLWCINDAVSRLCLQLSFRVFWR